MPEKDQVRQLLSMAMTARTQLNEYTNSVREVFGHAATESLAAATAVDFITVLEMHLAGHLSESAPGDPEKLYLYNDDDIDQHQEGFDALVGEKELPRDLPDESEGSGVA